MPGMSIRLAFLLALAACDETSEGVRQGYVERHREAFVYRVPHEQIVGALRELLDEHGVQLASDPASATLHTTATKTRYDATEYVVHVIPLRAGGYQVQIVAVVHDSDGALKYSMRREDYEWDLIQRVEPDRALEITRAANERADKVAPRQRTSPP